jgi:hypothetical protein
MQISAIAQRPPEPVRHISAVQRNIGPTAKTKIASSPSKIGPPPPGNRDTSGGQRPPRQPSPPRRRPRAIPDHQHLKYGLVHGFNYKKELPLDMIKMIIGESDLLITLLFAMTCRSFQKTVAWESIKNLDLDVYLPFVEEDLPVMCRSLVRRKDKLTSVESFRFTHHRIIEEIPLLLDTVSSHLKSIDISPSWAALNTAASKVLQESARSLTHLKLSSDIADFSKFSSNHFENLKHVSTNVEFADVPKVLKCCPNLQRVTVRLENSFEKLPKEWNAVFDQLHAMPNFREIKFNCQDSAIYSMLGNKAQTTFNCFMLDHVETNIGVKNLPLIRVDSKRLSDWVHAREFHEPSQSEYWKMYQWCYPDEAPEQRWDRTLELINSLIVPKRRMVARKSLGIYLDQMVTSCIPKDFADIEIIIKLVTALDSALLLDRGKFWFDQLGRRAFVAARAQGKKLRDFCMGENILWAGFIAQALKDPVWCRESGFLEDLLHILRKDQYIRNNHYNIRPGIFALMMNYDEILEFFYDACGRNYSNWHSGMIGRMIAEYGIATDIPPMSVHIGKLAKIMRTMLDAGKAKTPGASAEYWARLTELSTEDHRWDLELLSYFPDETPVFQECRMMLMQLCESALNYLSQRNAGTWLEAPDSVPMKNLCDLYSENAKWHPHKYREAERFQFNVWCAVFDRVEQGKDPARMVKRALEYGPLPDKLSNPVGYTSKNHMDLVALAKPGSYYSQFSVWSSDVTGKVRQGLHANISN